MWKPLSANKDFENKNLRLGDEEEENSNDLLKRSFGTDQSPTCAATSTTPDATTTTKYLDPSEYTIKSSAGESAFSSNAYRKSLRIRSTSIFGSSPLGSSSGVSLTMTTPTAKLDPPVARLLQRSLQSSPLRAASAQPSGTFVTPSKATASHSFSNPPRGRQNQGAGSPLPASPTSDVSGSSPSNTSKKKNAKGLMFFLVSRFFGARVTLSSPQPSLSSSSSSPRSISSSPKATSSSLPPASCFITYGRWILLAMIPILVFWQWNNWNHILNQHHDTTHMEGYLRLSQQQQRAKRNSAAMGVGSFVSTNMTGEQDSTLQLVREQKLEAARRVQDPQTPRRRVAFCISITAPYKVAPALNDAAAMLAYSIRRLYRGPTNQQSQQNTPHRRSAWHADLIAFVHASLFHGDENSGNATIQVLQQAGFTILKRDTPINVERDLAHNEDFQRTIQKAGCCGERELLKLYALTLTDFPVVVHVDLDSIMLQPLDDLLDFFLLEGDGDRDRDASSPAVKRDRDAVLDAAANLIMWPREHELARQNPRRIYSMFTRDYPMTNTMINLDPQYVGMQGGFWIVRPNETVFQTYVDTVRKARFVPGRGWGEGRAYGGFFGAANIQGLVPYYHGDIASNTSVELNRCFVNNMADSPTWYSEKGLTMAWNGMCLTGQSAEDCQDCQTTPLHQVYSIHYTLCHKPWKCPHAGDDWLMISQWHNSTAQATQCRQFHQVWHALRYEMELIAKLTTHPSSAFWQQPNDLHVVDDLLRASRNNPGEARHATMNLVRQRNITLDTFGYCQPVPDGSPKRRGAGAGFGYDYVPFDLSIMRATSQWLSSLA